MKDNRTWRIQSRWPEWAKWTIVTPRPHGERFPFDSFGLVFVSREAAEEALGALRSANGGEFRLIQYENCTYCGKDHL